MKLIITRACVQRLQSPKIEWGGHDAAHKACSTRCSSGDPGFLFFDFHGTRVFIHCLGKRGQIETSICGASVASGLPWQIEKHAKSCPGPNGRTRQDWH